jgi:hypothetical protein
MLNAGCEYVRYAPWTMIIPSLALFLTVMAVNLFSDRRSLTLDPRQRRRTGKPGTAPRSCPFILPRDAFKESSCPLAAPSARVAAI